MNCRDFQNELYEYVEGTLSAGARAAAEQHLTGCDACRRAVEKERKLTQALYKQLQQTSETLTVRPETIRSILAAARTESPTSTMADSIVGLWRWFRLAAVPSSLLGIAVLLMAIHFSGTRNHERISVPIMPRVSAVTPSANNNPQTAVSVRMSYRLPIRQFHQEGNLVVDALIDETVVASGTYNPGGKQSVSPKLEIKTPL